MMLDLSHTSAPMLMRGNALVLKTPVENAQRTSIEKHLSWSPDIPPAARFPLHRSSPERPTRSARQSLRALVMQSSAPAPGAQSSGTVRRAIEDSISQCPFLQMTYTAENPHADGITAPGARPRYRPPRHIDLHATSRTHDNRMAGRQTSCRQQTAPPQPRCSKDVTAHPHRPGARPGRPCQVPARSGQPLSGRSGFSPSFGTEFF